MNITGPLQLSNADTFRTDTVPLLAPGTIGLTRDGRRFRYAWAGSGAALVVGNVIQSPAQITNHQQLTPSAASVGALQIVATLGATAATTNQYAWGLAIIDTTPGLGVSYSISGHASVLSAGVITVNLDPADPIQVALTGSSRVSLQANPYNGVIQAPVTTLTGTVVGVAVSTIPASGGGWIQVAGAGGVLINGTPAVGQLVGSPGTVAGAADINSGTEVPIGSMLVTGVDTKVQAVLLNLP